MQKFSRHLFVISLLFSIVFAPLLNASAADFKREVIYQIITDRFFDGSSTNNNPSQSSGLYDSTKTNWRAYWGGRSRGHSTEDVVPGGYGCDSDLDLAARR